MTKKKGPSRKTPKKRRGTLVPQPRNTLQRDMWETHKPSRIPNKKRFHRAKEGYDD